MSDRQDDQSVASDLAPFADALKKLAPQPAHLSRDALLFEAGKAAATPRLAGWAWPSTAAAFAGVSFVLGAFLLSSDPPTIVQPVDRVVYVQQPAPPEDALPIPKTHKPESPIAPNSTASVERSEAARALQVRREVYRWGIDMLPEPKTEGGRSSQDMEASRLRNWLGISSSTYALPSLQPKKPAKDEEDDQ
jgi:hypothetical protein